MAEHDLALIRFVTARYRQLQGLRTVLDGVTLLTVWAILRWAPPDRHPGTFFCAVLLWTTLSMWGGSRVRRHYAHRWGRAMAGGEDRFDESIHALAHAPYQILLVSTAISLGGGFVLLLPALTASKAVFWSGS